MKTAIENAAETKTEKTIFDKYLKHAERTDPIKCVGKIIKAKGLLLESHGPQAIIGEICRIIAPKGKGEIMAEVVGLSNETVQLMAYDETDGIEIGDRVVALGSRLEVPVSDKLLGRVLNAFGKPIDGKGEVSSACMYPALASPPNPLQRRRITERITTGIRAIDGLLAVGKGQRLGIFSGSGVGKSTLMGMIARNTTADVNVIALIGERGRELNDFLEKDLGKEGLEKSVIVVTPGNSPPLARLRGAYVATAIAEYFRDQNKDVMLLFDSVTRFARAMREIGLSSGEPPAQRGFPPSMFDSMQKILERSGTSEKGSITGFYTVLVDGDDMDEPVADTVRGILDGHIVLSRDLAEKFHYPAIDIMKSVSRLSGAVSGPASREAEGLLRKSIAVYAGAEDLINVGAYHAGSNPEIDEAISQHAQIENFLMQNIDEPSSLEDTLLRMSEITGIEMPREEMEDSNEKLLALAKNKPQKIVYPKEDAAPILPKDAGVGSVAALFSSLTTAAPGAI